MVTTNIYSKLNNDYTQTNRMNWFRSREVGTNPITYTRSDFRSNTSFADAIYAGGPYSLVCPNNRSDILAQNVDYCA